LNVGNVCFAGASLRALRRPSPAFHQYRHEVIGTSVRHVSCCRQQRYAVEALGELPSAEPLPRGKVVVVSCYAMYVQPVQLRSSSRPKVEEFGAVPASRPETAPSIYVASRRWKKHGAAQPRHSERNEAVYGAIPGACLQSRCPRRSALRQRTPRRNAVLQCRTKCRAKCRKVPAGREVVEKKGRGECERLYQRGECFPASFQIQKYR